MIGECFLSILYIFFVLNPVKCLLNNKTIANFTISGLVDPDNVVLEGTGKNLLAWSSANDEFETYSLNGSKICFGTFPVQMQKIIWPENYNIIVLPFPGTTFSVVNSTTCKIIQTYSLMNLTNTAYQDQIHDIAFKWINAAPTVSLSCLFVVYQIQLTETSTTNIYSNFDNEFPRYLTPTYSSTNQYFLVGMIDQQSGIRTVRIWETKTKIGRPVFEYSLNISILYVLPLFDGKSVLCIGSSLTSSDKYTFTLSPDCTISNLVIKTNITNAIPLGQGSAVVYFQNNKNTMEVIRRIDGLSQNFTFSNQYVFYDADYKEKVLAVLDSSGRALVYQYDSDKYYGPVFHIYQGEIPDLECKKSQLAPEQAFALWIIITSAVIGFLILIVVLICIFKDKLPESIQQRMPAFQKCFKLRNKKDSQQPLLKQQSIIVDDEFQKDPRPSMRRSGHIEGVRLGMSDAEIIEAMIKEEQHKRQKQLEEALRQKIKKQKQKQQRQNSDLQDNQRNQINQYQAPQNLEGEQKILKQIERRKQNQLKKSQIARLVNKELLKMKRQEEKHKQQQEQETESDQGKKKKNINEEISQINKIVSQNIMTIEPQTTEPDYEPEDDFISQRKSLITVRRDKRQSQNRQEKEEEPGLSTSFFIVKKKNDKKNDDQND